MEKLIFIIKQMAHFTVKLVNVANGCLMVSFILALRIALLASDDGGQ